MRTLAKLQLYGSLDEIISGYTTKDLHIFCIMLKDLSFAISLDNKDALNIVLYVVVDGWNHS